MKKIESALIEMVELVQAERNRRERYRRWNLTITVTVDEAVTILAALWVARDKITHTNVVSVGEKINQAIDR